MDSLNTNLTNIKQSIVTTDFSVIQTNFLAYIQEVFEIFVIYSLYAVLTSNSKFEVKKAIKISFFVGFITFLADLYKSEFKQNIKSGILSAVGTGMIKNIS